MTDDLHRPLEEQAAARRRKASDAPQHRFSPAQLHYSEFTIHYFLTRYRLLASALLPPLSIINYPLSIACPSFASPAQAAAPDSAAIVRVPISAARVSAGYSARKRGAARPQSKDIDRGCLGWALMGEKRMPVPRSKLLLCFVPLIRVISVIRGSTIFPDPAE